MDLIYVMLIVSAVLGVIGSVAWFVFYVWLAKKVISVVQRDLDQLIPNLEQLLKSYSNLPANKQTQQKTQIMNMMMQANSQMRQMQDIQRQKYEVRMGELHGMAASAGIDWTPPTY